MAGLDLLLEADRRGILPADKQPLLDEARRRGLVPGGTNFTSQDVQNYVNQPSAIQQALERGREAAAKPPQSFGEHLAQVPGNILTGMANIPGAIGGMVTAPFDLVDRLQNPDATAIAQRNARIAAMNQGNNPIVPLVALAKSPEAKGLAEGVANALTAGVLSSKLPPAETKGQQDFRDLGGMLGLAAPFGAIKKVAAGVLPKILAGPVASTMAAGGTLGALPSLGAGDIHGAIEQGIPNAVAAGALHKGGELVGDAAGLPAAYLKRRALNQQVEALGGAPGILGSTVDRIARGNNPDFNLINPAAPNTTVEAWKGPEISPAIESARVGQMGGFLAGEKLRGQASDMLEEANAKAPKDATVPTSYAQTFQGLIGDTPNIVQSSVQKKLTKLAGDVSGNEPNAPGYSKLRAAWGADPKVMAGIDAEMGIVSPDNGGATFQNLTNLYQNLNKIGAGADDAARRTLGLAKDAVKADINKFKDIAPEAVRGWNNYNRFYATEVAPFYGVDSPYRKLTGEHNFNAATMQHEFEVKPSEFYPKLFNMPYEDIRNVSKAISQGPHGQIALDNFKAGAFQHLAEQSVNPQTGLFEPKKFIRTLTVPESSRQYTAALGDQAPDVMKFRDAIRDNLPEKYQEGPKAIGYLAAYHAVHGGLQVAVGNPMGIYHATQAGMMTFGPRLFHKIISNAVGRNLLADGILEPAGTPRAVAIQTKLGDIAEKMGGERLALPPPDKTIYQGPPGPMTPPTIYQGGPAAPLGLPPPKAPPYRTGPAGNINPELLRRPVAPSLRYPMTEAERAAIFPKPPAAPPIVGVGALDPNAVRTSPLAGMRELKPSVADIKNSLFGKNRTTDLPKGNAMVNAANDRMESGDIASIVANKYPEGIAFPKSYTGEHRALEGSLSNLFKAKGTPGDVAAHDLGFETFDDLYQSLRNRAQSGQVNPQNLSVTDTIIANIPHQTTENLISLQADRTQPISVRRAAHAEVSRRGKPVAVEPYGKPPPKTPF